MAHLQMKKQAPVGATLPAMRTRHVGYSTHRGMPAARFSFTGLGYTENEHKIGYSLGQTAGGAVPTIVQTQAAFFPIFPIF